VVKEELRRYKGRSQELERARQQQDVKLGQLQDALAKARAAGGGGAAGAEQQRQAQKELEAKSKQLEVWEGGAAAGSRGGGWWARDVGERVVRQL
jgi:hypothetical protein